MRRSLYFALALLVFCPLAYSQSTTVSGTIIDSPDGQAWFGGSYSFVFRVSPSNPIGPYFWNGAPFSTSQTVAGLLDVSGHYSVSLPSNTSITPAGSTWDFTVCPLATSPCLTVQSVTITGGSQTVSPVPPSIRINLSSPPQNPRAYADGELVNGAQGQQYFNVSIPSTRVCSTVPCGWTPLGVAGSATAPFLSLSVPFASTGTVRLANNESGVCWRNSTNTGDVCVTLNTSNQFTNLASPPLNSVQKAGAVGVLTNSNCTEPGNILNCDDDAHFKGPNPYVDVTRYGVRAMLSPTSIPSSTGITASITGGTNSATVSTSSCPAQTGNVCFVNGDGVVIYGAGASHSMTTPTGVTVTPSVAGAGTGTGIVVNGPTGATTYNYQVFAVNTGRGATAASSVASTTTGAASLGRQSVAITSLSRANNVVTATTAAHGMTVGSMVYISQTTDDINWGGWFPVATVPDTTHFTVNTGEDSRNGAPLSATGGFAVYFNANHITWTAVTGAWQYCVYGRTGGSLTWIGCTRPSGPNLLDLTFDDFGSTMMANFTQPGWAPNSPPGAATNNEFVTTITGGAGTTTLTLAANAVNSVAGATIRFDNSANFLTAANAAANGNGTVFFPSVGTNVQFPFNSFLTLPPLLGVTVTGPLFLNDTIQVSNGATWTGETFRQGSPINSFSQGEATLIGIGEANPGIYVPPNQISNWKRLTFQGQTSLNGAQLFFGDQVSPITFEDVNFVSSTGANDYMGVSLILRGDPTGVGNSSFVNILRNILLIGGPSQVNGASATPQFYCNGCGLTQIQNLNMTVRGLFYRAVAAGGDVEINTGRQQGGIAPFLMYYNASGNSTASSIIIRHIEQDTMAHPLFTNMAGAASLLTIEGSGYPQTVSGASSPLLSGLQIPTVSGINQHRPPTGQNVLSKSLAFGTALDGSINPSVSSLYAAQQFNSGVSIGKPYSLFAMSTAMAAPTAVVSAGGSVNVGNHTYQVIPVWWNGAEGIVSPVSNQITTTPGNQTVTVTWTAILPQPAGYDVYQDGLLVSLGAGNCSTFPQYTGTSAVISNFVCGSSTNVPAGGPAILNSNGVYTANLNLTPVLFANLGSPANGDVVYCSDCTIISNPCVGGGTGTIAERINGTWNCTGGGGANPATQFSIPYYSAAGTSNVLSGVAPPTTPSNVPEQWVTIPTGGVATAPQAILAGVPINAQSGTSYTTVVTDRASLITANNASAETYTASNPSSAGFGSNFPYVIYDIGAGTVTENASGFSINGGGSLLIPPSWAAWHWSDNTNYRALRVPDFTAFANTTATGALTFTSSTGAFGTIPLVVNTVYNTQSAATNTNIAATNMVASTSAMHAYAFNWTISLTVVGTGCTGNTTVVLNAIFTDPNAGGSTTQALGTITLAASGNGTVGFVANGSDSILAKTGTAVQYSTSSYTAGSGCSVNPTYQVTPTLSQLW